MFDTKIREICLQNPQIQSAEESNKDETLCPEKYVYLTRES